MGGKHLEGADGRKRRWAPHRRWGELSGGIGGRRGAGPPGPSPRGTWRRSVRSGWASAVRLGKTPTCREAGGGRPRRGRGAAPAEGPLGFRRRSGRGPRRVFFLTQPAHLAQFPVSTLVRNNNTPGQTGHFLKQSTDPSVPHCLNTLLGKFGGGVLRKGSHRQRST